MHIEVCRDKNPKMREQKKRVHLSSRIRGATLYQFEISQQHPSEVWFWNHFHFNITPYNNTKYRHALWTPGTWHHWFAVHVKWCIKLMLSQILASNNVCVSFVLFVYGCWITDLLNRIWKRLETKIIAVTLTSRNDDQQCDILFHSTWRGVWGCFRISIQNGGHWRGCNSGHSAATL